MTIVASPPPTAELVSVPFDIPPREPDRFARFESSRIIGKMTVDEYVAFERRGEIRYEYVEGMVVEVPGGSLEHSQIIVNVLHAFYDIFDTADVNCRVFGSDQKIAIDRRTYRYPDGSVVCGKPKAAPHDALQNPTLLFEVLSPSTEREDRTEKFIEYQRIPSLMHYVLIEQARFHVTHFEKSPEGVWAIAGQHTDLSESLTLTLDGKTISIPLTAIYKYIDFSDESEVESDAS